MLERISTPFAFLFTKKKRVFTLILIPVGSSRLTPQILFSPPIMILRRIVKYLPWTLSLRIHMIVWSRILTFPLRFLPGNSKIFGPPRRLHYSTSDTPGCAVTRLSSEQTISQAAPTTNSLLVKAALRISNPKVLATYVAKIVKGRYFGANGGAIVSQDDGLVWTLSPTNYTFKLPLHEAFSRVMLTPPRKYRQVIHLATRAAKLNYWHWMMDCIPRFRLLAQAGIDMKETPDQMWIIDHSHLPFQLETLKALGIKEDSVLIPHRYLHIEADVLIVPSNINPTLDTAAITYARQNLVFLRQIFRAEAVLDSKCQMERIYLARRGPRSITNEQDVVSFLQREGFSVLHCEDFPVWKQAQLFAAAKIVISLHGSALTNILFCRPGTRVVEIFSPDYIVPYYWSLSNIAQLHYAAYCEDVHVCGAIGYRFRQNTPVTLDVKKFESFCNELVF
jgi:capsular polysaccharide biosynthesis protein